MSNTDSKTLRLLFPQWQGGNNPPYFFGAQLLNWLMPKASGPVEQVNVQEPDGEALPLEDGIIARSALLKQLHDARQIIERHRPERMVVVGGDCLVDLAPFAYLNERYDGELAVLWIDSHPDVMTPNEFPHAHAMVLGNLLGEGDADFTQVVKRPLKPANVMYAGVHSLLPNEVDVVNRLGLRIASPADVAQSSASVLQWLKDSGAKHLAIHLDLDVLDATFFRSVLFAEPGIPSNQYDGVAQGRVTMATVTRLIGDVSKVVDVVGLGIAEHLPWDTIALKNMLEKMPLIGQPD
ncbi:arginase family protein [Pseudomonas syringae pv. syringae]|uniref:arginase family protein n=1 Tax=Pseudomonas syringae TaxID=317 RepID=UPI0023F71D20|nr:arginase family protein [Pseudomonas syringae]MDF5890347.1 arginase family protein [Pseudomonas syringae pv. syringae]